MAHPYQIFSGSLLLFSFRSDLCLGRNEGRDVLSYSSDVAGRASSRRLVAPHHLGKEVDIIIAFSRHLLPNGVQLF
jgi:hypothetical protein